MLSKLWRIIKNLDILLNTKCIKFETNHSFSFYIHFTNLYGNTASNAA